jgi:hypothetical protein
VASHPSRRQGRGILIPALLDDVKIPLAFRRTQAASFIGWTGSTSDPLLSGLRDAVADVIGVPAVSNDDSNANRQARFVSATVEWKRKSEPDPTPRRWVVYIDNDSDAPITVQQVKVSSPSLEQPIEDWGPVCPKESSDYELEESDFDPSGDRPEVSVRFMDSFGQRWSLRRAVLKQIGVARKR